MNCAELPWNAFQLSLYYDIPAQLTAIQRASWHFCIELFSSELNRKKMEIFVPANHRQLERFGYEGFGRSPYYILAMDISDYFGVDSCSRQLYVLHEWENISPLCAVSEVWSACMLWIHGDCNGYSSIAAHAEFPQSHNLSLWILHPIPNSKHTYVVRNKCDFYNRISFIYHEMQNLFTQISFVTIIRYVNNNKQ